MAGLQSSQTSIGHSPIRLGGADGRDLDVTALIRGARVRVAGHVTGPGDAPLVVALGGISAGRHAADHGVIDGWWWKQAGPDRPIDTRRVRLLSLDYLDDAIEPFPTTQDQARAVLALMDHLGVERARVIGASYGGMIALALAEIAPSRVTSVLAISAADRASAMAKAWRSIQREAVTLGLRLGAAEDGLDLARRLAMTTYRTPDEFEDRFGPGGGEHVESYLAARGGAYARHVRPERFLALSQSLDAHDVDVSGLKCPVRYVAVREDRLVAEDAIRAAAERTPFGVCETLSSRYGHDAFLKETAAISQVITNTLKPKQNPS